MSKKRKRDDPERYVTRLYAPPATSSGCLMTLLTLGLWRRR